MFLVVSSRRHLVSLIACVAVAVASSAGSATTITDQEWIDDCHQAGFDPTQLACKTCLLLPKPSVAVSVSADMHQKTCLECCQAWKDTQRTITKPYEAAVLVAPATASGSTVTAGELAQFLEQDWNDLVQAKGSHRLVHLQVEDTSSNGYYSYYQQGGPPRTAVLYLLEERMSGAVRSVAEYSKAAKETIHLDGWKRDDIRDMLSTLLP
jgi:hypothetical protein